MMSLIGDNYVMAIEKSSDSSRSQWEPELYNGPVVPIARWGLAFRQQLPATKSPVPKETFIFAHGAKFNWEIWRKTGILDYLRDKGHRVLAFDLPPNSGFENTRTTGPAMDKPVEFWKRLLYGFNLESAVGVFPSLSGHNLAMPILREAPDTLSGAVLIAPINADRYRKATDVPTGLIWAKEDEVAPAINAAKIAKHFSNVTTLMLEGAGNNTNGDPMNHAPYISRTADVLSYLEWFGQEPATASQRVGELSIRGAVLSAAPSS